jgi:subtilisin family serine protease
MKVLKYIIFFFISLGIAYSQSYNSYLVKFKNTGELNKYFSKAGIQEKSIKLIDNSKFDKNNNITLSEKSFDLLNNLEKYAVIQKNADINSLKNNFEIESIEPNYIYHIEQTTTSPNDEKYSEQWALKNINAEFAWKKATGKGVVVGVIDTGIDFEHPDLVNQLWINSKEDINKNGKFDPWSSNVKKNGVFGDLDGIDNDGNGFVDDIIGYDFVDQKKANIGDNQNQDPIPFDEMGHGTMVSGIIAAEHNNKIGISGLAYNSKIMMIRTFDIMGNAESHNIASAILYAVINKARVINCSFGDAYSAPVVYDAMKFAQSMGCVIVASSGNNGWNDPHYPSDYEGVISVGASDINSKRYGYSNYGDNLAVLAPGANVLSTDFFSTYSTKNGTSFSAPHVSALAALLLEINPLLSSDEIKSIMSNSAKMPTTTDWNQYWGAGIIDAGEAVNNTPAMNISISSPLNEQVFERNLNKNIALVGSINAPLMKNSCDIYIGKGFNPTNWTLIKTITNTPIINDTIAAFSIAELDMRVDTNYTFRVVVEMKNGKIIEQRRRITLVTNNPLQILNVNVIQAWDNNVLGTIAGITTNMPSKVSISYVTPSGKTISSTDFANFAYYHPIKINKSERLSGNFTAKVTAEIQNGATAQRTITLNLSDEYFPLENYNLKSYTIKPSYLFDGSAKLYNEESSIVANDLTGGVLGKLFTYNFNPSTKTFEVKDSLNQSLIAVGMGDSNGDGINEMLFKASGTTTLFQHDAINQNPFSKILYENSFGNFWAQALYNIDGKPNDEIICYSDSSYHVVGYSNGAYHQLAQTKLPLKFKKLGTLPGLALGDFDGDGNKDMAFSNEKGNLFVFNYKNDALELQFIDSVNYSKSSQYMSSLDFDGDGKDEIAILDNTSGPLFGLEEVGEPIWQLRVYKFEAPNNYKIICSNYIYGVITGQTRSGVTIRNGMTCGDIDGDKKDEILVSAFPNVYAFKYDSEKIIKPAMILKNTFTNNCIIHDFDKNGINEIGFNDGNSTYFAEMNKPTETTETPINFKGNLIDNNTIEFTWDAVPNAEFYQLYRAVLNGNFYDLFLIEETQSTAITIDTFKLDKTYEFILAAVNTKLKNQKSNYSNILSVHTALPWAIKNVYVKQHTLEVTFAGKLKSEPIESNIFYIKDSKNIIYKPLSILPASDSLMIISFTRIPLGSLKLQNETFLDYWNNTVYAGIFIFENVQQSPDEPELYLTKLNTNSDPYKFSLNFSENPDFTSMNKSSFRVYRSIDDNGTNQDIEILSMSLNSNNSAIDFELSRSENIFASGKTYFITCLSGKSTSGHEITKGAGNTLAFVLTNDELNKAYVYPNPIKYSENYSVYFANLPLRAVVEIYNIEMNKIKELSESDGNGGVKWDCRDENGNQLNTGIYFFKVIKYNLNLPESESEIKKFAIIK